MSRDNLLRAGLVAALLLPLPAGSDPTLDHGILLFEQGKDAEARAALTPLAQAQPTNARAAYYLGRVVLRQDEAKQAVKWLEAAVTAEPNNPHYHLWLGRAYGTQAQHASKLSVLGLAKKARKEFERALEIDPDHVEARVALMQYFIGAPGIAGGSVEKARLQAAEIMKRDPYRGLLADAEIAEDQKDLAGAEAALLAASRMRPDSLGVRYSLTGLYANTKRYDQAFDVCESILATKPHDANALYLIGRTGAISGLRLDRAEAALNEYLTLPPPPGGRSPAGAHWRLGMIHEKSGDKERARADYRKALELDPKFEEAKKSLDKLK